VKNKKIKTIAYLIFLLGIFTVVALFVSKFGCIFRKLTHIPCPACGMTRAIISLMKLNFSSYFYYNAFALPVLLSIAVLVCSRVFGKPIIIFSIVILILNFAYYLYRISYNAIP